MTIDNDKLIADFMHLTVVKSKYSKEYLFYDYDGPRPLNYNTSWDWLMTVIEKIEELGAISIIIANYYCIVTWDDGTAYFKETRISARTKIDMVYESVVEFIKFYNKIIK